MFQDRKKVATVTAAENEVIINIGWRPQSFSQWLDNFSPKTFWSEVEFASCMETKDLNFFPLQCFYTN